MTHFRLRNWDRYQHYKDRNPPWVKLYRTVLDDADLMRLPDASKWLAVGLLLVASRYDNCVPYDPAWVGRTLHMSGPADLDVLLSIGYIEGCDASKPLAERKQKSTPKRTENREQNSSSTKKKKAASAVPSWPAELVAAHESVMGAGSGKLLYSRYGKAWGGLVEAHGVEACADAIRRALASPEAKYLTPEKVAMRFADFRPQYDTSGLADIPSDVAERLGMA